MFIQSNSACAPLLFLSDGEKGRGGSLINRNARGAAEVGAEPGNAFPTFAESFLCVERAFGIFFQQKRPSKAQGEVYHGDTEGSSGSRLMAPIAKGFQGWLLVGKD